MKKSTLVLSLFLSVLTAACGSSDSSSHHSSEPNFVESPTTINKADLGATTSFTYLFNLKIDAEGDAYDFNINYPQAYTVPMYVQENGKVSLIANEFPKMVYRACSSDTTRSDCDIKYDDLGSDMDLVIDLCGFDNEDDECGSSDTTVFDGQLTEQGLLSINAVSLRVRIFPTNSSNNGQTASATDAGFVHLSRMMIKVTNSSVESGSLLATGTRLVDSASTLVAAGIIPVDIPLVGGAHYAASLDGNFSIDPLTLQ